MERTLPRTLTCAVIAALLGVVAPALARAEGSVTKLEKKAKKDVSATAKKAEKDVNKDAKTVDKDVTSEERRAVWGTRRAFSDAEIDSLAGSARSSFAKELKDGAAAYTKALDEAKKVYSEAEEAALRAAASRYLERYKGFLSNLQLRIDAIEASDDAMVIAKRLVKAASARQVDSTTSDDIKQMGQLLGLFEGSEHPIVPGESGGLFNSSWGMGVLLRGLAPVGGAQVGGEGVLGFIVGCQTKSGQPEYTFFVQPGLSLGVGAGQVVSGGLVFFWQPGTPDEAQALYAGLTGSFSVARVAQKDQQETAHEVLVVRRLPYSDAAKSASKAPSATGAQTRLEMTSPGAGWTAAGVAAAGATTLTTSTGVGFGLDIGVRWKVLGDPFKGKLSFPSGKTAAVPGFYIAPIASAKGGFSGGVEVSQLLVDPKLLAQSKNVSSGSPH